MPHIVELNSAAHRDHKSLEHSIGARVSEAIDALAENPRPVGCVKLVGEGSRYRVRVGAYRIVYMVDDQTRRVIVERIQHRREVYR